MRSQFCEGCPYVPDGVRADATSAEVVDWRELWRYKFARDPEGRPYAEQFVGLVRVHAIATESTNPVHAVGAEAAMLVEPEDRSPQEILTAIDACTGPRRTRLQRWIGARGVCMAARRYKP